MASAKTSIARTDVLGRWRLNGGLLIIGYEMYRNLTQHKFIKSKKQKEMIDKALVEPGKTTMHDTNTLTGLFNVVADKLPAAT